LVFWCNESRITFALAGCVSFGGHLEVFSPKRGTTELLQKCQTEYLKRNTRFITPKNQMIIPWTFSLYKKDFGCSTNKDCAKWILESLPKTLLPEGEKSVEKQLQEIYKKLSVESLDSTFKFSVTYLIEERQEIENETKTTTTTTTTTTTQTQK
jgi:hypothetical protein